MRLRRRSRKVRPRRRRPEVTCHAAAFGLDGRVGMSASVVDHDLDTTARRHPGARARHRTRAYRGPPSASGAARHLVARHGPAHQADRHVMQAGTRGPHTTFHRSDALPVRHGNRLIAKTYTAHSPARHGTARHGTAPRPAQRLTPTTPDRAGIRTGTAPARHRHGTGTAPARHRTTQRLTPRNAQVGMTRVPGTVILMMPAGRRVRGGHSSNGRSGMSSTPSCSRASRMRR
jgi:hypothetical protein